MRIITVVTIALLLCGCISTDETKTTTATTQTDDGSACQEVKNQTEKDGCYIEEAEKTGELILCDRIADAEKKAECYLNVNLATAIPPESTTTTEKSETTTTETTETTWTEPEQTPTTVIEYTTTIGGQKPVKNILTTTTTATIPSTTTTLPKETVRVYFLDVGYGDSTLILARNTSILTNCGTSPNRIKEALDNLGVKRLDYLIVTQPTEEDYGGCGGLMDWMNIANVLDSGQDAYSGKNIYVKYVGYAQMRNHRAIAKGFNMTLNGVTITVLNPNKVNMPPDQGTANSMVYKLTYGENSILITGDCDSQCDTQLTGDLKAKILKIPNHGPKRYSSPEFIQNVKPEIAIIGYGPKTKEYPSPDTTNELKKLKAAIYAIDTNGTIEVDMNATRYWIRAIPS